MTQDLNFGFCECGCGEKVSPGKRFVNHHYSVKGINPFEVRGEVTALFVWYKGERMECLVWTADLPKVIQHHWHAFKPNRTAFYAETRVPGKGLITMHRLLLPGSKLVDHKNHSGLDNRILRPDGEGNIRPSTYSLNGQNRRIPTVGATRMQNGRWVARIKRNYEARHLGCFATKEEAHAAYLTAAQEGTPC